MRHLNMTDFIFMNHTISGIFRDAWKRLSYNKFERVFSLASIDKRDGRHLVLSLDNTDFFLLVLQGYHTTEDDHFVYKNNYLFNNASVIRFMFAYCKF